MVNVVWEYVDANDSDTRKKITVDHPNEDNLVTEALAAITTAGGAVSGSPGPGFANLKIVQYGAFFRNVIFPVTQTETIRSNRRILEIDPDGSGRLSTYAFNDSGESTTDIWSAARIIRAIAAVTPMPIPRFTSFSIQDQATQVNVGTTISGSQTFLYSVENPSQVTGNLSIIEDPDGTPNTLSSSLSPSGTSVALVVTSVTLNAGESQTYRIQGTSTSGQVFHRDFVVEALSAEERYYYGLSSTANVSTVPLDPPDVTSAEAQTGVSFDITVTPGAGQFLFILVPTDHDITTIFERNFNVNVTDTFTRTADTRIINSVNYHSYTLGPAQGGAESDFRVTLG